MATMAAPDPPWPHRLVGEVIGTSRPPNELFGDLSARFRVTWEDGGGALFRSAYWVRHTHLTQAPRIWGVPSTQDGVPHLDGDQPGQNGASPTLIFSVPVGPYSRNWWLFAFVGELPAKALPPVVDIQGGSFAVGRVLRAVPRSDHLVHFKVVVPPY